jgi:release factor glutamine methyltransferase
MYSGASAQYKQKESYNSTEDTKGMCQGVCEHVYEPQEDTFLLLNQSAKEVKKDDKILEIGTGSGFIAKNLAERVSIKNILCTDVNPWAVKCARGKGLKVLQSDLFERVYGKFDLILFNPPYLPMDNSEISDKMLERAWDGGKDGLEVICRFLEHVGDYLAPNGRFLLVVSSLSDVPKAIKLAENKGFKIEQRAMEKFFFETLYVLRGRKVGD